jgi:signal transduction histidine kinase/CheY-like chemotaxis protein
MEKRSMTVPWLPVVITDMAGSSLTLFFAIWCLVLSRQWQRQKPGDHFRHYIFFLTLAIACFAISRSFGHLIKQILLLGGHDDVWRQISPISGAVNTTTFIVIFAITLYFHRLHTIQGELEFHQKNLEMLVRQRTEELALSNLALQKEITERKLMMEEKKKLTGQLRQTQKMEAIGTLAGGIAHDFNNILTPIIGYTELTLHQLSPDSAMFHNLEQVRISANRAKELVKQILTFSRKTEQQQHSPVELSPLIKETLKLIRASIPSTIEIQEYIDPQSGPVLADPTQIHQVLVNLCTNAYQAMAEKGGVLTVSLHGVHLEEDQNELGLSTGQYIKLSVADTGVGMDEVTVERACEPFFTTKELGKGSGMGLSIVHGIVASHGGRIIIDSREGKGTTIMIYLPKLDSSETAAKKEAGELNSRPVRQHGSEHLLLIDDEEAIVEMQKISLEELGYRITPFTDSELALNAFKEHPANFDLVITDQSMPKLPGTELAAELVKIRKDIPIILCTGYSSVISEERAGDIGIRKFLMKPVSRMELAREIRQLLDKGL